MPRCIRNILQLTNADTEVWVSYVQIYCEVLSDLLSPSLTTSTSSPDNDSYSTPLQIREKAGLVYVEGLSRARINT